MHRHERIRSSVATDNDNEREAITKSSWLLTESFVSLLGLGIDLGK